MPGVSDDERDPRSAVAAGVMRRVVLDLDDPAGIDRLWAEMERRHEVRRSDPALRDAIERRLVEAVSAGRIDEAGAAEVRAALDHTAPAAVLDAYRDELIPDRPALGAFPRAKVGPGPDLEAWLIADPRRLGGVLRESCRFGDVRRAAAAVVDLAERLGIAESVFAPVLKAAARELTPKRGNANHAS